MAGSKTSTELIQSIKVRAMIPTSQNTFTDEDFLRFATEELQNSMFGEILRHHEDFFLYSVEVPLESGVTKYRIPARAGGVRLREVQYRGTSGNLQELTRIEVQDLPSYANSNTGSNISAFYVQNNNIALLPNVNENSLGSGSLVFYFYMTPNDIVTERRTARITNINRDTGEIAIDSVPRDSNGNLLFSATTKLDFISQDSPHSCELFDVLPEAVNSTTDDITLVIADIPSTLTVGDVVSLAGESLYPQIPAEQHMQLAMRAAMRCMTALGDLQGYQNIKDELVETSKNTTSIIDNRVEGAPRKVVNRHGILRDGLFKRRFKFRS